MLFAETGHNSIFSFDAEQDNDGEDEKNDDPRSEQKCSIENIFLANALAKSPWLQVFFPLLNKSLAVRTL